MQVLEALVMLWLGMSVSGQTAGSQPATIGVTVGGGPKCLVSIDVARPDRLVVHVLAPQPAGDILTSLPAALQNVEQWPAVVVLLDETRASGTVQRLPLSLAAAPERPMVNGTPDRRILSARAVPQAVVGRWDHHPRRAEGEDSVGRDPECPDALPDHSRRRGEVAIGDAAEERSRVNFELRTVEHARCHQFDV
jgi:hypothetical protein